MLRRGLPTHTQVLYPCLFLIAGCDQGPTCPAVLRDLMQHPPFFNQMLHRFFYRMYCSTLNFVIKMVGLINSFNYSEVLPGDADGCCS